MSYYLQPAAMLAFYIEAIFHTSWLFCNKVCISDVGLYQTTDTSACVQLADTLCVNGDKKVYGKKRELRTSQAYSKSFGFAMHQTWADHRSEIVADAAELTAKAAAIAIDWDVVLGPLDGHDLWADAQLLGVFDRLVVLSHQ